MKMTSGKRALDKMFKRRNRYEIPDWQRQVVWDKKKKQQLIDSILRGWKLPKFYFVKLGDDEYEVVDGQQRLTAIFEFFSNELSLSDDSGAEFGGSLYRDLPSRVSDVFDDFELEYDEIEDATEEELREFFQRLQEGLPLTSSEKLNAIPSKLRDYVMRLAGHPFFKNKVTVANTRYAHFDIVAKVASLEIEGMGSGLRFDDVSRVFKNQGNFSPASAVGKRLKAAFDYLDRVFPERSVFLRNRTIVQAFATLVGRLIESGKAAGYEQKVRMFLEKFMRELSRQVELGQDATDQELIAFQKTVNANIKAGARLRQEVLLRRLLTEEPELAALLDSGSVAESGLSSRVGESGEAVRKLIGRLNGVYAAVHGEDLFKPTSKTVEAQGRVGQPIKDLAGYESLIDDLYFLFHEGAGSRLDTNRPEAFRDINILRTEIRHDVDHGNASRVRSKKKSAGRTFQKYSGSLSPETLAPEKFVVVQAALLRALERDLSGMLADLDSGGK